MAHEKVPHDGAKAFGMGSRPFRSYRRDHDACVRDLLRIAPVAPDDAEYLRLHLARKLERANEIDPDILLPIAPAHAKDNHPVASAHAPHAQPFQEARFPSLVLYTRGKLAHIVGRP